MAPRALRTWPSRSSTRPAGPAVAFHRRGSHVHTSLSEEGTLDRPVSRSWWDDGDGPRVGAWFTGRNVTPERTWETRSQVVVTDPGREFAFQLRGSWTRWGYTFEPVDGGTRLTESWHFPPDAVAGFQERYGEEAEARLEFCKQQMREGIPATLAAIKAAAEDIAAVR
ncbi:MAG: SRPBCC family protein [Pseudonocardiaceae bacterium]